MAGIQHVLSLLIIALVCLTLAQDVELPLEPTIHINPHLPVTIPITDTEETTTQSNLYRGRPRSTIQFEEGEPDHPEPPVRPVHPEPPVRPVHPVHPVHPGHPVQPGHPPRPVPPTVHLPTEPTTHPPLILHPITSTSPHTTEEPRFTISIPTPQPTTGLRWVYSGGRWHRVRSGSTTHATAEGNQHGGVDVTGYHHRPYGHQVVHIDSSETNNWNNAIHHEINSGQTNKHFSKTSIRHSAPDDSSSSSGGSGTSHGSSGSGESGSSGSGEPSASGSGSE